MSVSAAKIHYRKEAMKRFERGQALLRHTVTTEAVIEGKKATFLVAGSGGATATTRGADGDIPARDDENAQYTADLREWHDLVQKTNFDIFASQGNQKQLMQRTTQIVMNRRIDKDILDALGTASTGIPAASASLDYVLKAYAKLAYNDVPEDDNIFAAITPGFRATLMKLPEFASKEYVELEPFKKASNVFKWAGINFIVHNGVPNAGSAEETVYFWHKEAIGHAVNQEGMDVDMGYENKQRRSGARTSMDMAAKVLQSDGIVKGIHTNATFNNL